MSEIKRYNIEDDGSTRFHYCCDGHYTMQEDSDGDYVKYTDHEADLSAAKAEVEDKNEIITNLQNVLKSDEAQIRNLVKRNEELRNDLISTAHRAEKAEAERNEAVRLLMPITGAYKKYLCVLKAQNIDNQLSEAGEDAQWWVDKQFVKIVGEAVKQSLAAKEVEGA